MEVVEVIEQKLDLSPHLFIAAQPHMLPNPVTSALKIFTVLQRNANVI